VRVENLWRTVFRLGAGAYWLYFASQKWHGVGWMKPMIEESARVNPVPGLHEFLTVVVAPNWFLFALGQMAGETVVGALLVLGLGQRLAAVLGTLLALNLALTVAFLSPDVGLRWLYYLAVLVNGELIFVEPGLFALGRTRFAPSWLRS
jgi:uncharacterized membrane protein YphA (DoxX/SURF4 family)